MLITITYTTKKTKALRVKTFIKGSVKEAIAFFNWRYGNDIVNVECYTQIIHRQ